MFAILDTENQWKTVCERGTMYHQEPHIETKLDALDELEDVHMTISGLASITLALSNTGMPEPEAIRLVSYLLNYCALSARKAREQLKTGETTVTQ